MSDDEDTTSKKKKPKRLTPGQGKGGRPKGDHTPWTHTVNKRLAIEDAIRDHGVPIDVQIGYMKSILAGHGSTVIAELDDGSWEVRVEQPDIPSTYQQKQDQLTIMRQYVYGMPTQKAEISMRQSVEPLRLEHVSPEALVLFAKAQALLAPVDEDFEPATEYPASTVHDVEEVAEAAITRPNDTPHPPSLTSTNDIQDAELVESE